MIERKTQLAALVLSLILTMGSISPTRSDERPVIWFAPNGESPDLVNLFVTPEAWREARTRVNVFKFGPQQVSTSSSSKFNTLMELVKADAFRKLKDWGVSVALEAPAVKEWDCNSKRAAMITLDYIRNVRAAGGDIKYVAMDEPLVSGFGRCRLTFEETAARTASYVRGILSDASIATSNGKIAFGDIEPYPSYSVDQLKQWINALQINGFKPSFFHLDVDLNNVDLHPQFDLAGDLRALKAFLQNEEIPFGIIFWSGRDPESSDQNYYKHVIDYVKRIHRAIGMPEQSIFQSWVLRVSNDCSASLPCSATNTRCSSSDVAYCGSRSVPINLPESSNEVFSHTRLINDSLEILSSP
jgi:hypothetical protein